MQTSEPNRTPYFRAWIHVIVLALNRWNHNAAVKFPMQATLLCYAAYVGFPQICKELLQQGVRVNAKGGRYGSTALHSAI
jgi:ankyrin repeat protein